MSTNWRVFVQDQSRFVDHQGKALEREWRAAGLPGKPAVRTGQCYELKGGLSEGDAADLTERLLRDPVTQEARVSAGEALEVSKGSLVAEIWLKPGVSDPVAETARVGAEDLGLTDIDQIHSGKYFVFQGKVTPQQVTAFCEKNLMNPLIQSVQVMKPSKKAALAARS